MSGSERGAGWGSVCEFVFEISPTRLAIARHPPRFAGRDKADGFRDGQAGLRTSTLRIAVAVEPMNTYEGQSSNIR